MDLDDPIHWLDSADASFLRWNYRGVGYCRQRGPLWHMELEWQGKTLRGVDETRDGAKGRMERWVRAQPGLPGRARR